MWRDSKTGYGLISIALHWAGAILIIAIWLLGNQIDDVPSGPARVDARNLHIAVAILSMLILVPRLGWRFANFRTPLVETKVPWLDIVAKVVKWALLAAILIMLVSGPLVAWSGRAASFDLFGLKVPSPLPAAIAPTIRSLAGPIHSIVSKLIFVLVGLHVLGALKHLVIDRDGVLRRMLVPVKSEA